MIMAQSSDTFNNFASRFLNNEFENREIFFEEVDKYINNRGFSRYMVVYKESNVIFVKTNQGKLKFIENIPISKDAAFVPFIKAIDYIVNVELKELSVKDRNHLYEVFTEIVLMNYVFKEAVKEIRHIVESCQSIDQSNTDDIVETLEFYAKKLYPYEYVNECVCTVS